MRAYIESYGCTLNAGEAREVRDLLVRTGWQIVRSPAEADLAVLATCVVIDKTEREMLRRIKTLSAAPRLIITGCMATACRDKAEALAPAAEFVPPADLQSIAKVIGSDSLDHVKHVVPDNFAIVPIATGCLGNCSYCITRLARGDLRSRPLEDIVKRVAGVTSHGPLEVQITAQDTAAYGSDIGHSLPELVERICRIPNDFRLRIGMMNPGSALAHMNGISRMYLEQKVFKFVHLPVQSGSDRILEMMSRGYSVHDFRTIVSTLRGSVPDTTLSTDIIVGYPGETEADHEMNLKLIMSIEPDIVNVTRFSPRPRTRAAEEGAQVVGWKAKDRSRELTSVRFAVALAKNRMLVGTTVRALSTESGKAGTTILRTNQYKQIVVKTALEHARWFEVRVTRATPTYLVGELEGPG